MQQFRTLEFPHLIFKHLESIQDLTLHKTSINTPYKKFKKKTKTLITMSTVKRLVADNPLVIFSKTTCSISYSIKTLLRNFGANPKVYELDEVSNGAQVEGELLGLGCDPSVPVVYIGKKLVGGANEVMSLNMRSGLKPLLIEAKALWL